jgi:hypothetical protein
MSQQEIQERLKELLQRASREQDAAQLQAIIEEVLALLADRQKHYEKPLDAN